MRELRTVELFSGIGMQYRGIENSGCFKPIRIATCEIERDAIISYAGVHCGMTMEMVNNYAEYPSRNIMAQELDQMNIGFDPSHNKKIDWFKISNKKSKDIEKIWLACKLTRNMGDISKVKMLPSCDLVSYSFPCTDISNSGKQIGLQKTCYKCGHKFNPLELETKDRYHCPLCGSDEMHTSRSGMLIEVERLIQDMVDRNDAPHYLLMENVKALVSSKFIDSFNLWKKRLDMLGYNTYSDVMNGLDVGIPQHRERTYAISIRKDIDSGKFSFPKPIDLDVCLMEILDDSVDEKYYVKNENAKKLISDLEEDGSLKQEIEQFQLDNNKRNR